MVSPLTMGSVSYAYEDSIYTSTNFGIKNPEYWASFSDDYLYNNMTNSQKAFYDNLSAITKEFFFNDLDGQVAEITSGGKTTQIHTLHKGAVFNGMTSQEAYAVYIIFANANPQYYFLSAKCATNGNTFIPAIYDEYIKGKDREVKNETFKKTIDVWTSQVKDIKGDQDRISAVYNLIAKEITFSESDWDKHQSAATAVFNKKSVCAGYSELFSLILKNLGYKCIVLTSKGHEWVKIKIGDNWYNADITADDTGDVADTKFFLKSDETFNDKNHIMESIYNGLNVPKSQYSYNEIVDNTTKVHVK